MHLRLITPPAASPVSLAQAKAHLRVDHPDDDALIQAYVDAAVGMLDGAEGTLGRALVDQTWRLELDGFPAGGVIVIPLPPLKSVQEVKYRDETGLTWTVALEDLVVHEGLGLLEPLPGRSWPSSARGRRSAWVEFTAGYGPADLQKGAPLLPGPLRAAILLMVGDLYANRETGVVGTVAADVKMSTTVDRLVAPYRSFRA